MKFKTSISKDSLQLDTKLEGAIDIDDDCKPTIQPLINLEPEQIEVTNQTSLEKTSIKIKKRGRPRGIKPRGRSRPCRIKPTGRGRPRKNIQSLNEENTSSDKVNAENLPSKRIRKPNTKFMIAGVSNQKVVKKKSIKAVTKVKKTKPTITRGARPPLWIGGPNRLYGNSYENITLYCPEEERKLIITETLYLRGEPVACGKCGAALRFICNCGKEFKGRRSYQQHARSECKKQQNFACDYCRLKFYIKRTLIMHIQRLHSNEI